MNDENVNSDGVDSKNTSPEEMSGDSLSENDVYNKKEITAHDGGDISESKIKENSSGSYSVSEKQQEAAKSDVQEPSQPEPHNTIKSERLNMNSGSSPSLPKKKRSGGFLSYRIAGFNCCHCG